MLVLSRKHQDTIVIDQRIRIKVLEIRGDRIRLGIEAPEDVAILRGELQAVLGPRASRLQLDSDPTARV
jgi:carbon storage regulator